VALTPVSPISWSYSTWLLYIIPLIITVFAPIRRFSGPLRFAYLEYATKIASWVVSLLKVVVGNFHSIPTLALPALFFLPVIPILFFILFPALPIIWHYISHHYRCRLNALTTSVGKTIASLELTISRAREALALAHTYEKQALYSICTTRGSPLLEVSRHSTDFGTPNNSDGRWRLIPRPGTLGAELAGKVLDTEKQMAVIEDASQEVRALSEQAVAVATEGEMAAGEKLAGNAAKALENVVKQMDELGSTADQARCKWVEFRRRLNAVTASVAKTIASLDLDIARARQAMVLAHTYEKQAMYTVSTTRGTPLVALSRHSTDFGTPVFNNSEGHRLIPRPGTLGADLAGKILDMEKQMAAIEGASQRVRDLSEQAVAVATEGDITAGERLAGNAATELENVGKQVKELCLTGDQARAIWVEFRRRLNKVTSSASTTTANLDSVVTQARRADTLAHTYEKQELYTVSTSRGTASRHSTDFCTSGTMGADLAGKVLDTEKQMSAIEGASQRVRSLLEQAVTVATEGDITAGERLAGNAATELESVGKQVKELCSTADQARRTWIEFRCRLNKVTSSTSTTTTRLDLDIARARQAIVLAHTYERQALCTFSTTRGTASRHSTDLGTPNDSGGQWRLIPRPGTLGGDLAVKVLETEKQMTAIEDASQRVGALAEQAVAVATEGDIVAGERLAGNAASELENVGKQVKELCSIADQARAISVEFRRRLNNVASSASTTTAILDSVVTQARRADTLAHTYEKQALHTVSTTRGTTSRHSTDFFTSGTLGANLAGKVLETEKHMSAIEGASQRVRSLLEQAVKIATEGDITAGERLAGNTATELESVGKQVKELCSTADQARAIWVEFRRRLNNVTSSASATTARLDSMITRARRADTLAHTYEKQALAFISTTRRNASQTFALHGVDSSQRSVQQARDTISNESERVRALGNSLKASMSVVETKFGGVDLEVENIRVLLEEAVVSAVDGDVAKGEKLTANAADSLKTVMKSLKELCSTSDGVHEAWVELSVKYWTIP